MDEQDKELEEILRMFDKAPSPSSERNNQAQMRQNNLQSRQVSQNPIDAERTARTSNHTAYKRQPQSSKPACGLRRRIFFTRAISSSVC